MALSRLRSKFHTVAKGCKFGQEPKPEAFFGQLVCLAPLDTPHTGETCLSCACGASQGGAAGRPNSFSRGAADLVSAPIRPPSADCDAQTAECVGVLGWVCDREETLFDSRVNLHMNPVW
jgi:hypothetical protein